MPTKLPTYSNTIISITFLVLTFFVATTLLLKSPPQISSSVSSCEATVSPTSLPTSQTSTLAFRIDNTASEEIVWVRITRPNTNFTVTGGSASGWNSSNTSSYATFSGGNSIPTSESGQLVIIVSTSSSDAASSNWTVQVSDDLSGADPTTCTGSTGVSLVTPSSSDTTPPNISSIVVSEVSDTSVKVTWTTDEAANSQVDYGTTDSYGSTKTDSTYSTSHELTLESLSGNTTYHFLVTSADSSGNSSDSDDLTFSTAKSSTTVTKTVTASDTNIPTLTLDSLTTTVFKSSPTITGLIIDDTSISSADYSLDGNTWTSVNKLDSKNQKKSSFSFTPTASKTGKYTYKVRARDSSGNLSTTVSISFEIDQTPPTVACTTTRKINPESPPISCQTSDNQSVSKLEYSQDAGVTWTTITNNSFTPTAFEEGNYSVLIRAEDLVGNLSANYTQEFIIDRLPPRLGSLTVLTDTLAIPPKTNGVFVLPQSKTLKLFTPILGGPILTRLSSTTQTSPESSMTIQPNSIFWTGDLVTDKSGIHDISITATDGVGNLTQKSYGQVFVFEEGVISSDKSFPLTAKIAIYKKNWETESFVFKNSQTTNPNGKYSLYLTPGTFYLEFSAPGHVSKTSEVFTLKSPSYISENITLASKGNFLNNLWQQISNQPSQTITPITHKKESENAPISFPEFSILDPLTKGEVTHISIRSRPTVVTILDSWSPTTSVQISELKKLYVNRPDIRVVVIIPGETPNFVSIFRNRTGSDFPILPDPTYDLSSKLGYAGSPSHFILNREAEIIEKLEGLTTNESLSDLLL